MVYPIFLSHLRAPQKRWNYLSIGLRRLDRNRLRYKMLQIRIEFPFQLQYLVPTWWCWQASGRCLRWRSANSQLADVIAVVVSDISTKIICVVEVIRLGRLLQLQLSWGSVVMTKARHKFFGHCVRNNGERAMWRMEVMVVSRRRYTYRYNSGHDAPFSHVYCKSRQQWHAFLHRMREIHATCSAKFH